MTSDEEREPIERRLEEIDRQLKNTALQEAEGNKLPAEIEPEPLDELHEERDHLLKKLDDDD